MAPTFGDPPTALARTTGHVERARQTAGIEQPIQFSARATAGSRCYFERVYGIPPEQVVGSAGGTKYSYGKNGRPFLTKEPKLLLNDNHAGKPEGIHLIIGRRPIAAFGNSTGDQEMLEYEPGICVRRLAKVSEGYTHQVRNRLRLISTEYLRSF